MLSGFPLWASFQLPQLAMSVPLPCAFALVKARVSRAIHAPDPSLPALHSPRDVPSKHRGGT
jgi:hypothetical protein